ncbi:MAG: hypothetical protein K0U86_10335 [Planctomycetes bacterium]|nr:hypothetical protein [Planctomycetota bacterium]MCH9725288.1 hypothetical protein [Planctomycetota bacterium]MCH9779492.1 hypothetical protein [Planctomycetota bacterium]MCH9792629.1 hypothetical protein [Planctomycetota bacterium]
MFRNSTISLNRPAGSRWRYQILTLGMACFFSTVATAQEISVKTDPISRYFKITYPVPRNAPEVIQVHCTFSASGSDVWQKAQVMPLVSETALKLLPVQEWNHWNSNGFITERRAAGLHRTLVFNPYPAAVQEGKVDAAFRIEIRNTEDEVLATYTTALQADQSDVFYIEDWSQVFQKENLQQEDGEAPQKWTWREGWDAKQGMSLGNSLYGNAGKKLAMPQLSYPLDLKGWYAVYIHAPGSIRLRFTGDERNDLLSTRRGEEVLWRWAKLDHQNLVLKQHHNYTGYVPSMIDYVKFVPLTQEQRASLDAPFKAQHDKFIAAYWEPYSFAFHDDVQDSLWHREYLTAYSEANMDLVDMQIGRMGMKVVYESRLTDNLYYATRGDPIGAVRHPQTDNVGRMQQFTNTLQTSVRHARELGLKLHANFGASNCYPGSPLQGQFSKDHPEWMRGSTLRYEVPEVRAYALSLFRESLELGARGISIDYCRYPGTIDVPKTANLFQKELRAIADEFSAARAKPVPILVRFPAHGVNASEKFDYTTWAREGWVDYLCPSNIQGRHNHFDITPYTKAVAGTKCTLLPSMDGLSWGNPLPGPFLWRAKQLYEAGAPGLYIYQADSRVLGKPTDRRTMRMLGSSQAVQAYWEEDSRLRPERSKGIYITRNMQIEGWHGWQRLRVWTEGIDLGPMEFYLDGKLIDTKAEPPYLLGTEEHTSDKIIPRGKHILKIRARDGDGWLEQTFPIVGAG